MADSTARRDCAIRSSPHLLKPLLQLNMNSGSTFHALHHVRHVRSILTALAATLAMLTVSAAAIQPDQRGASITLNVNGSAFNEFQGTSRVNAGHCALLKRHRQAQSCETPVTPMT